jgi:hypothetical protein
VQLVLEYIIIYLLLNIPFRTVKISEPIIMVMWNVLCVGKNDAIKGGGGGR